MGDNISSLQTQYLLEQERARLDREQNGEYTKIGLQHLVNSARIQLRLAALTTGEVSAEHQAQGYKIIRSTHADMVRLGLIRSTSPKKVSESNDPESVRFHKSAVTVDISEDIGDPNAELNELIGLTAAKGTINKVLNQFKADKLRYERKIPTKPLPLHMVFMGNPGTGKTTVARLVAQIYKQMGLLSKGHLVETDRSGLVAEHVGQTAPKTKKLIESAVGGVLFIDEAYSLYNPNSENDFGREAIDALLKEMEDKRNDLAVIVAGYTDTMPQFITSNPGLASRFLHYVYFDDYSPEEMFKIFKDMGSKIQETLSPDAESALMEILKEKSQDPYFGNARGVRNLFDKARLSRDTRIMDYISSGCEITPELLTTIKIEDIQEAIDTSSSVLLKQ